MNEKVLSGGPAERKTRTIEVKAHWPRDALLLRQMPKKQTEFVLLLKQNKSDLVFHDQK